jgi:uncharacterized membrane protein
MDPLVASLYLYLLVLVVVPLIARWRWGLRASLVVVVIELGLVALIYYVMSHYRMFPDPFAAEPAPKAPMEVLRRGRERSMVAMVYLIAWMIVPAIAALVGGGLSLAWSTALAIWRGRANNRPRHG